jgi:hypothetical protein
MLANGDGSMQHGNNETNNITPMEHRRFVSEDKTLYARLQSAYQCRPDAAVLTSFAPINGLSYLTQNGHASLQEGASTVFA